MYPSFIVVDNFYTNPIDVYEFARKQSYFERSYDSSVPDRYSMHCNSTRSFSSIALRETIQYIIRPLAGNITSFDISNSYDTINGAFITSPIQEKPIINVLNSDYRENVWIGILFLTPNAHVNTGITLYKHNSIQSNNNYPNIYLKDIETQLNKTERYDFTRWDVVDSIGNVFNRFVCFRASNYHCLDKSTIYKIDDDKLLTQIFIFNTEQ